MEIETEFPIEMDYIWMWYLDLRSSETLSFTEIRSWSKLTGNDISSKEVECIMNLEREYWRQINAG